MSRSTVYVCFLALLVAAAQAGKLVKSSRIVEGDIIDIKQAPYTVQIKDPQSRQYCAGTLISSQHVVTAAHCFDDYPYDRLTVVAGANTRFDPGQKRKISALLKQPLYDASTYDHDIAVFKLDQPVETNESVRPVSVCTDSLKAGDNIQVSGWGKLSEYGFASDELRTVRLPIISKNDCSKLIAENDEYGLSDSMVCAYLLKKDTCTGDSGGPAIRGGKLCGVVSWGHGCARENSPGIYTDVHTERVFYAKALKDLK